MFNWIGRKKLPEPEGEPLTPKEQENLEELKKQAEEEVPLSKKQSFILSARQFMKLYGKSFILILDPASKDIVVGCRGLVIITAMKDEHTGEKIDLVTPLLNINNYSDSKYVSRLLKVVDGAVYNFAKAIYARKRFQKQGGYTFFKGKKGMVKIGKPKHKK
jgi:hypothetical protein